MKSQMNLSLCSAAVLLVIGASACGRADAQAVAQGPATASPAPASTAPDNLDEIVVTGTSIRGVARWAPIW